MGVNPFSVAIDVGVAGVAYCTVSAAADHDGRWLGAAAGCMAGMAVLRVLRGWWDRTTEQLTCGMSAGDGVGLPVPEPAPMDPANLIELEAAFEALDQRLRLGGSGARVALAAGRRRDRCRISVEEQVVWASLVRQITAMNR